MITMIALLAVVVVGLMVGVEVCVAAFVTPIFDRLPADGGLAARSDGARVLGRVMPVWYITSLTLAVLWTVLAWHRDGTWAVVTAAALLALSVVMSIVLLVPINSRMASWSAGRAPADWRAQIARWDRLHYVRVAVIIGAFVLLVVAC